MLDALTITEAEAAGLCELAALDLAMARDFAARAQAAEDPETANDLARGYQRMARSYRQTLALKAKLRMDTIRADRETPRRPAAGPSFLSRQDDLRIEARAEELHGAVARVIWAEREGLEAEVPDHALAFDFDMLDEWLADQVGDPRFTQRPLDELVAAACRDLSLDPGLTCRWRDLPEAPVEAFGEADGEPAAEPDRMSSG